jgi:uncharacterized protein YutE (UPF0331/DUF86 family)
LRGIFLFLTQPILNKINQKCFLLEQECDRVKETSKWLTGQLTYTEIDKTILVRALERQFYLLIEWIVDIGNLLIDTLIMRDPGSYEDIIMILEDEKVIAKQNASQMRRLTKLRKFFVKEYDESLRYDWLNEITLIEEVLSFIQQIKEYCEIQSQ